MRARKRENWTCSSCVHTLRMRDWVNWNERKRERQTFVPESLSETPKIQPPGKRKP